MNDFKVVFNKRAFSLARFIVIVRGASKIVIVKMSGAKRKLNTLSLSDKLRLINEVDKGVKRKSTS